MSTHKRAVYTFATLLLTVVGILIVPLPPWLLDVLLGINVFGSALVLLLSVTVEDPLEFSAFAPALLVATLFRLSLDVSATRLILTAGATPGAVGAIIPAFGEFVVHGNLVVGLIVFSILITIQFVVIASGSQRVAEVAARFTLDAMPGKQMAIDADVHAGVLDAEGARRKREAVQREADFYGAMDGAGKFVKGDAVAALVIVALNLTGGIVVGVAYHGLPPLDALNTFALLSIGNALVTTLPAFLISTAMGMMVTRVASEGALGSDLAAQLFARPDALRSAGGLLLALALVPALPRPLFLVLGASAFALAHAAQRARQRREAEALDLRERTKRSAMRRPELALGLVGVDAISIEIGADLAQLLVQPLADALLDRIGEVRRALAADIGIVLPGVRLRDELARDPRTYAIRVRDRLAGAGRLELNSSACRCRRSGACTIARPSGTRARVRIARGVDRTGSPRTRAQRRCARLRPDIGAWLASGGNRARARSAVAGTARVSNAARAFALDGAGFGEGSGKRRFAVRRPPSRLHAVAARGSVAARSDRRTRGDARCAHARPARARRSCEARDRTRSLASPRSYAVGADYLRCRFRRTARRVMVPVR